MTPRQETIESPMRPPGRHWLHRLVRLRPWWQWHCRRAGGLFVGLRYHFPCSIVDDDESRWTQVSLSVGLLCATLHLDLLIPRRELPLCEPKATANTTAAGDEQPNDPLSGAARKDQSNGH
jgi:hypothetical protein